MSFGKIKIKSDCCEKNYELTSKQHNDLERGGFLIYCQDCAEKLNLNKHQALKQGIKIYKM